MPRNSRKGALNVSRMNWNRVAFFALGTFLGGWVLGLIGGIVGAKRG